MSKGKLYRSPNGKFMGVCTGLANWLRMDVGLIRLGFILATVFSSGVVVIVYIALGVFLPIDECRESESIFDKMKSEFSSDNKSNKNSRRHNNVTVEDVRDEFNNLKSRVSKMENSVFNKEKDWDERFKNS